MRPLFLKYSSCTRLLFLILLWVVIVNPTALEPMRTSEPTAVEAAEPAPGNVTSVSVVTQDTSSITLKWDKVDGISTYRLQYGSVIKDISDSSGETFVQYVVHDLTDGTEYSFTLFTVLNGVNSSGFSFSAATAPENVVSATVVTQTISSITLEWAKVNSISTYRLQYEENGATVVKNIANAEADVQYVVSNLTGGTKYSFTLFTVFNGVSSSGLSFPAATAPENVASISVETQTTNLITLKWNKVNSISTYRLQYEVNGVPVMRTINAPAGETVQYSVSGLTAGTEFSFTLFTEFNGVSSSGFSFSASTVRGNVASVSVETQNISSITLKWDKVNDTSTYKLQYQVNGVPVIKNISDSAGETFIQYLVPDLTDGTEFSFTLFTVLNGVSSSGFSFTAATVPENVASVSVVTQSVNSITLEWDKVNNISTYKLQYQGSGVSVIKNISDVSGETFVQHMVSDLTNGTEYSFTLFTVFNGLSSSGFSFSAATAPGNVIKVEVVTQDTSSITLKWDKVDGISTYELQYDSVSKNISDSAGERFVQYLVPDLTDGTEFSFTLFTVLNGVSSSGISFSAATAPVNVGNVSVVTQNTSSITLEWNKVNSISTYKLQYEVNEAPVSKDISNADAVVQHVVSDLTAGTEYNFTLFSEDNGVSSSGFSFSAATDSDFAVVTQDTSSITLRWHKIDGISTYKLQYEINGVSVIKNISDASGETFVQHVVPGLTAGTQYNFTLFTVLNGVTSFGFSFTAATVPLSVTSVRVSDRLVDRVTLEWENPDEAWKHNLSINDTNASITQQKTTNVVSYLISNLKPGTMYQFSVTTVFSGLNSAAYIDHTLTQIDCSAVTWSVTNSSIQGTVEGLFSKAMASYGSETLISPEGKDLTFSDLLPGATYNISLLYETKSELYPQCSINIPIIPPSIFAHCSYWGSGYSALIKWDEPNGVWTNAEVIINGKTVTSGKQERELIVNGLQPAKTYKVSVNSKLETEADPLRSEPFIFFCSTDNRGVIAGSVVGVLLCGAVVCVIAFIVLRKPDYIRRKIPFILGSKTTDRNEETVSAAKFPDHFQRLSLGENRGFSQEYEALAPVGTGQTCKAAILPENREKNRFNILPYDWCRVKLNTSAPKETDYINASYIPGYNSSREYIATQGPLPDTVVDFWRMIWEQRVKRVVMVTNHIEAGLAKCAEYWPGDLKQSQYGDMLVSVKSELKEPNWTLRQFTIKQKRSSEQRSVQHFHFTVWPYRGVPQGTEVLIQFRRIVRQDIESDGSEAPTVVHCSDGVGRTGTFIALDFLLQQLEKQQAVGIKDCLHRMRRHRSHMVQTESQYVFLHQCIMDNLQPSVTQDEHIYENDDTLYANTIQLQEII